MKASLLPLVVLFSSALSAPTPAPAEGVSFPITDLIDSDLTVEEYAHKLEAQEDVTLTKRQYSGTTYNQLTDGTACRPISVIYARGTTQAGNVGDVGSEGPTFLNAIAARVGGASRVAVQGVNYPADVFGFLAGGSAEGATTMFNLIGQVGFAVLSVVSGYIGANEANRLPRGVPRPKLWFLDTARARSWCTLLHRDFLLPMQRGSALVSGL